MGPPSPKAKVIMPMCSIDEYAEQPLDIALPPEKECSEQRCQQTESHQHAAGKRGADRSFDQHLAADHRVERDIEQKAGENGGDRRRAFGMSIGKPIVQRNKANLGSVAHQQRRQMPGPSLWLKVGFDCVEMRPQQRRHAFAAQHLLQPQSTGALCRTWPSAMPTPQMMKYFQAASRLALVR